MKELSKEKTKQIDKIVSIARRLTKIPMEELLVGRHKDGYTLRRMVIKAIRQLTSISYEDIGQYFGVSKQAVYHASKTASSWDDIYVKKIVSKFNKDQQSE